MPSPLSTFRQSLTGFTMIFLAIEVVMLLVAFRGKFFRHLGYVLDLAVVSVCLYQELAGMGKGRCSYNVPATTYRITWFSLCASTRAMCRIIRHCNGKRFTSQCACRFYRNLRSILLPTRETRTLVTLDKFSVVCTIIIVAQTKKRD